MKTITVLAVDGVKRAKTAEIIIRAACQCGLAINLQEETSPEAILAFGVTQTPAVVIDNKVRHSGSVPTAAMVQGWLTEG